MRFKKLVFLFSFLLLIASSYSQEVVHWKFTSKKIDEQSFELRMSATIDQSWHIYSMETPEGGPLATSIQFTKNPLLTFQNGIVEEGSAIEKFEKVFKTDVKYYENKVEFVQVVRKKANAKTNVMGFVEYMACTNERCLTPVKKEFSISIQ